MMAFRAAKRGETNRVAALGLVCGVGLGIGLAALATARPAAACSDEAYIGTVCTVSFDFCPRGYLQANGQVLQVQQYAALFSLLGPRYGGDGRSTFALPNFNGRAAIGTGAIPGSPDQIALAQQLGQREVTLSAAQVPVPPHSHPATLSDVTHGTQTVNVPANAGSLSVEAKLVAKQAAGDPTALNGSYLGQGTTGGDGRAPIYVPSSSIAPVAQLGGLEVALTGTPGNGAFAIQVPTVTGGTVTIGDNQPTPAGSPVPTQSPALGQTICIAVEGIYPSRP